ncbi:MAG: class IV adenylate cyclase [Isosphaeraceae bacterium]|nr:class IV adenylate cyclase [Isosphaeraceae bacterium]
MITYEVELKFRVSDHQALRAALAARGARSEPSRRQEDRYLAHPARDFAATGEALRLRSDRDANRITYKGVKLASEVKTREEIEVGFESGPEGLEAMGCLFERLGFRPVAVVAKTRTEYSLAHQGRILHVALDEADGLGTFAEVETIAHGEDDLPNAREGVVAIAAELGLAVVEPRSYLRMLLESRGLMPPVQPRGQ